jgi:hypothetical protein
MTNQENQTLSLPRELRAPRIPKRCPVEVTSACTINDPSGNPRRGWIVRDHAGNVIETLHEGSGTELDDRYPYFHIRALERFGLGEANRASVMRVDVRPGEWKELMQLAPSDAPSAVRARKLGDRCERYSAVVSAVNSVRMHGTGVDKWDNRPRSATIYYRRPSQGGTHVDAAVRRAMTAMVRAGMAERVGDPDACMADGKTRADDISGQYRATDTTPYLR